MAESKMNRAQGKPYDEILSEIQTVLGKDNARIMAKVGLNLGKRWGEAQKEKSRQPKTLLELWEWIANYLENDMFVADPIQVKQEKSGQYHIKYGEFDSDENQCRLCVGNLVKEKGGIAACPIMHFFIGASRVFKNDLNFKRIQLQKITKPASKKPGACNQTFIVELSPTDNV